MTEYSREVQAKLDKVIGLLCACTGRKPDDQTVKDAFDPALDDLISTVLSQRQSEIDAFNESTVDAFDKCGFKPYSGVMGYGPKGSVPDTNGNDF